MYPTMLTNIALYYYLIYTPIQFWPCEAQTHVAMRSFGLPQHGTTAGIFHDKGKAIIEIAHLDAYTQYSLLLGTPIRLSQNITLESSLGGRYTSLKNLSSYFDPVVHTVVSYVPDAQSVLRVTSGYDRGQFIARAEQFYFISKEWSVAVGWCLDDNLPTALYAQVSYIHKQVGVFWVQQGAYSAMGFHWMKDRYTVSVLIGNTQLLGSSTLNYVP
ncbi:MAG: hypothetical protein CL854_03035 [Cryomorphaceae bacterium]|nr:hypothetical protein [Cryomorphaceae bacterium]